MPFFESHVRGCSPITPCSRCKLYQVIIKIDPPDVRNELLRLIEQAVKGTSETDILDQHIDVLDLPRRPRDCLLNGHITTVGDLLKKTRTDLLRLSNFGPQALNQVEEALKLKKLKLTGVA